LEEDLIRLAPTLVSQHYRPLRLMSSLTVSAIVCPHAYHDRHHSGDGNVYHRRVTFPGVQRGRVGWVMTCPKTMSIASNLEAINSAS
jgi:hypothetical protein